jgi:hypothetical protein
MIELIINHLIILLKIGTQSHFLAQISGECHQTNSSLYFHGLEEMGEPGLQNLPANVWKKTHENDENLAMRIRRIFKRLFVVDNFLQ